MPKNEDALAALDEVEEAVRKVRAALTKDETPPVAETRDGTPPPGSTP